MPKICYVERRFTPKVAAMIKQANEILEEYAAQGFVLTLRQLYYQFVARDILPNNVRSYDLLGTTVGNARLAGLIDWAHLEDRTRNLQTLQHFNGPQDALTKLADWYHVDMWAGQSFRPEVWIEKDALLGVIEPVCQENDVPYFSCRGYTSLSEVWRASLRFHSHVKNGQMPYIIHFGDHDPSGMDMSRDIWDRMTETFRTRLKFTRMALNMNQIEEYDPPPNPAKVTDCRYEAYVQKYGEESWELDALEPKVFRQLIEDELDDIRDDKVWAKAEKEAEAVKKRLTKLAKDWGKRKR